MECKTVGNRSQKHINNVEFNSSQTPRDLQKNDTSFFLLSTIILYLYY